MMSWIDVCNTGNYPQTNYVNLGMTLLVLLIAIAGIVGIIRNTLARDKEAEG